MGKIWLQGEIVIRSRRATKGSITMHKENSKEKNTGLTGRVTLERKSGNPFLRCPQKKREAPFRADERKIRNNLSGASRMRSRAINFSQS